MTDEARIEEVVQHAADRARDSQSRRGIWFAFVLLMVGILACAVALISQHAEIDELGMAADANARNAQQLAEQVRGLGGVPIVQPPTPGERGETGPAGRGIAGTSIIGGRLLLAYSDGTSEDKGQVVGAAGAPGPQGKEGRGVVGTAIVGGRLVLSYSDSSAEDVGQVVGPAGADGTPGRSVASVGAIDGRLMVTYDDGTTQDAGPLPPGPAGRGIQRAEVVDCRWFVTYTDGTREDAGAACTTETVTPTPAEPSGLLPIPTRR